MDLHGYLSELTHQTMSEQSSQQPSQAQILAALQSGSFRPKNPPKTVAAADLSRDDLVSSNAAGQEAGPSTNARRIYCFREGCGSVILEQGAASWVDLDTEVVRLYNLHHLALLNRQLPVDSAAPFPHGSNLSKGAWHVPTPFAFENIGYSRPDASTTLADSAPGVKAANERAGLGGKGKVKWLICAECDLGPLGWGFEGAGEAWLAADRVRYAAQP